MKLSRFLMGAVLALACVPLLAASASAQSTTVPVPVGEWLGNAQPFIIEIVLIAFAWLSRHLPGYAVALLKTFGVEQMLSKAVAKAINSVAGASHDAVLKVDVGNAVVASALSYVTAHAPAWLIEHAGGWPLIREKILARIKLEAAATITSDGMIVKGNLPKVAKPKL